MTKNSARKSAARARAAEMGIPYTQALRETAIAVLDALQEKAQDEPLSLKAWSIQRGPLSDGSLPYALEILETGRVAYQDFWRGTPDMLMGFVKDPKVHELTLSRSEFLADPQAAVGLFAVLRDDHGPWSTHHGAIEDVEQIGVRVEVPVYATFNVPDRGAFSKTETVPGPVQFEVSQLLGSMSDEVLDEVRRAGWTGPALAGLVLDARWDAQVLGRRDDDLEAAADWADEHMDEVFDPAADGGEGGYVDVYRHEVSVNPRQAERWLVSSSLHMGLPQVSAWAVDEANKDLESVDVRSALLLLSDDELDRLSAAGWAQCPEASRVFEAALARRPGAQQASGEGVEVAMSPEEAEAWFAEWVEIRNAAKAAA